MPPPSSPHLCEGRHFATDSLYEDEDEDELAFPRHRYGRRFREIENPLTVTAHETETTIEHKATKKPLPKAKAETESGLITPGPTPPMRSKPTRGKSMKISDTLKAVLAQYETEAFSIEAFRSFEIVQELSESARVPQDSGRGASSYHTSQRRCACVDDFLTPRPFKCSECGSFRDKRSTPNPSLVPHGIGLAAEDLLSYDALTEGPLPTLRTPATPIDEDYRPQCSNSDASLDDLPWVIPTSAPSKHTKIPSPHSSDVGAAARQFDLAPLTSVQENYLIARMMAGSRLLEGAYAAPRAAQHTSEYIRSSSPIIAPTLAAQTPKHCNATSIHTSPSLSPSGSTTSSILIDDEDAVMDVNLCEETKDKLVNKLMRLFRATYFIGLNSRFDGRNIRSHQGGMNSSSSSSRQTLGSSSNESTTSEGKRGRGTVEEDGAEENGGSARRKRTKRPNEDGSQDPGKRFACPFFKRRPHIYISKKSCPGPGWNDVHRLKEHLYRCHMRPLDCNRCGACFNSAALLRDHQRAEVPCQTRDYIMPEGLTQEQKDKLRSRKKTAPDLNEIEKWKNMYHILFPDDDPQAVPSPYYEISEDSRMSQPLSAASVYEDFLRHDLPTHIRQQFALEIERQMGPVEDRFRLLLPDIVHRAHRLFWTSASMTHANRDVKSSSSEPEESRMNTPPSEDSPVVVEPPSTPPPTHAQPDTSSNNMEDSMEPFMFGSSNPAFDEPWTPHDFSSIINEMEFALQNEDDSETWVAFKKPFERFPQFSYDFE